MRFPSIPRHDQRLFTLTRTDAILFGMLTLCGVLFASTARAETYTSANDAPPIYKLQGEYMGVVDDWGGTWGAQIIATSEKKLAIHLLDGGLPGAGAKEKSPTKEYEVEIDGRGEQAELSRDKLSIVIKPDVLTIKEGDKTIGELNKIVRESKTLGAKPPANAIILFDGDEVDTFKGSSKVEEKGLLGVGGTSSEVANDHKMHIEFRTPFQPEDSGQGRGNSGVYIQGRYELQVLDSFGLRGEDNECGGIYQIARPKLNMCYPPLTWQTYDIDFTAAKYSSSGQKTSNAKVTIKHNGVTIHEDLELPKATPGHDAEADKPGALFLQNHGNPVVYKNIWIQLQAKEPDTKKNGPKIGSQSTTPE